MPGERFDPGVPSAVRRYAILQFALVLGCSVHFLQLQATAGTVLLLAYFAYVALAMACIGGMLEGRAGFARLELARSLVVAAFLVLAGRWFGVDALPPSAWFAMGATAVGSAIGAWLAMRSLAVPAPPARIAAAR